jgi:hypothetical protein
MLSDRNYPSTVYRYWGSDQPRWLDSNNSDAWNSTRPNRNEPATPDNDRNRDRNRP